MFFVSIGGLAITNDRQYDVNYIEGRLHDCKSWRRSIKKMVRTLCVFERNSQVSFAGPEPPMALRKLHYHANYYDDVRDKPHVVLPSTSVETMVNGSMIIRRYGENKAFAFSVSLSCVYNN